MAETVAASKPDVKSRDVLAELDSIESYLSGLIGDDPLPGQDSNRQRLAVEFTSVRSLTQNVVELAAAYGSGVTHKDRLEKSMGQQLSDDQVRHLDQVPARPFDAAADKARIAQLEAQIAQLRGGASNG